MGTDSIAVGPVSTATGANAIAVGTSSTASAVDSVALGFISKATGQFSTAVGPNAQASGDSSTAIGQNAATAGVQATALGVNSSAGASNALALGANATASNANAVALGFGSVTAAAVNTPNTVINGTTYSFAGTGATSTVSVGAPGAERTNSNVAAGRRSNSSTDAVNGSQLFATNQSVDSLATTVNNINTGGGIKYFHANSALADSIASGTNSVAIGPQSVASGTNSVAAGNGAIATGNGSIALGQGAQANNANDVALGSGSTSQVAVGTSGATIKGTRYAFAGVAPVGTVSIGSAGAERTITNVAAGRISETSTEAINGSQLNATNQAIESLQTGVGTITKNAVQYDLNSDGSKKNSITLQGGDINAPVIISNVGAGVANNDAVNVGQLKQTVTEAKTFAIQTANNYTDTVATKTLGQANDYTDQKFNQLNQELDGVRSEARQAAAIGLAAASLRYDDRPGKLSVAVGGGLWRSESALAFGAGYTSENGRVRGNVSGTASGGHVGVGAGLSFTLN